MRRRIIIMTMAAIMRALSMAVGPAGGAFADSKKNPNDPACAKDRGGDNKNCPGKKR